MMKKIALLIAIATLAPAQAPVSDPVSNKAPAFEVAAVRVAKDDGSHDNDSDNGIVRIHNYTLKRLISRAWEIDMSQIYGGPNWIDSESYDINAKIPAEFVRAYNKVPQMMQNLLIERFQLVIHREPRQVAGYELVLTKKGSHMENARPGQKDSSSMNSNNSNLKAQNVTMEAFARYLSRNRDVGKLVADKTGLAGGFNFDLDWMPERIESSPEPSADDRPSIFAALQERLGLKLEAAKVQVMAIVIDRAEKPDAN
jgi:uncharacterized protein (TIGR03435 family)